MEALEESMRKAEEERTSAIMREDILGIARSEVTIAKLRWKVALLENKPDAPLEFLKVENAQAKESVALANNNLQTTKAKAEAK
eukprot:100502-Hanusia_phi.AAC.1